VREPPDDSAPDGALDREVAEGATKERCVRGGVGKRDER
jgi:hypothetical protein